MTDVTGLSLDSLQIEKPVALILGEPLARLENWQVEPLSGGFEMFNRLYRLSGQAHTPSGERPWSLVLKTIRYDKSTDVNPQARQYWKREASFYRSALIADLACTFVPPRCYGVDQDGEITLLWLEDIHESQPKPWTMQQYGEAARCLGCFNGSYLAGRSLPDVSWLSQRWLRFYVEESASMVHQLPELRKLSFFQSTYTELSDDFILEAWGRRSKFFDAIESLPQTYCHQDAFDGNLFLRRDPAGQRQVVGLDWAYTGIAAVGEEIAPLVIMAFTLPIAENSQLYETCLQGYLTGLAEAGYQADPRQVRFCSLAAMFYRYLFGAFLGEGWPVLRDERNHPMVAARFGVPAIGIVLNTMAAHNLFFQEIYHQSSHLLEEIF